MHFTRENTKSIKGIAILMMLLDHILISTKQPIGLELTTLIHLNGENLFVLLRSYCGTCVSIFMFLGGYGLYKLLNSEKSEGKGRILFEHILLIFKSYWKVFVIFVPLGFILFNNQGNYAVDNSICNVFDSFNRVECLQNFLGISNSYNIEWWFLKPYIIALFIGTVFNRLLVNNDGYDLPWDLFKVIVANILIINIIPEICWKLVNSLEHNPVFTTFLLIDPITCIFLMGMVFAKHNLLVKLLEYFPKTRVFRFLLGFLISIMLFVYREFLTLPIDWTSRYLDIIIVPCQVIAFYAMLQSFKWLDRVFLFIGKHSTNIWLTHSFFCYYFAPIARIVFAPRNIFVDLLILIIISICSSMMINLIWGAVKQLYVKSRYEFINLQKKSNI